MQLRSAIAACFVASAIAASTGCATGGTSGTYQTFMQKCLANATTEDERSDCAWKNAERMASGN
jgi:H+/gluconate symporter-like permease